MHTHKIVLRPLHQPDAIQVTGDVVLGRDPECDIVLSEPTISWRHAQILVDEERGWIIEDLGSTNGTYVDGLRINRRFSLLEGNRVRLDNLEFDVAFYNATVIRDAAPGSVVREDSWWLGSPPKGNTVYLSPDDRRRVEANLQAARAVAVPSLLLLSGESAGSYIPLRSSALSRLWTIGSDPRRDIVLADPTVSAYHAKLTCENGRWKIVDMISANGTYVNDEKVLIRLLCVADVVTFGGIQCRFCLPLGWGKSVRRRGRTWLLAAVTSVALVALSLMVLL